MTFYAEMAQTVRDLLQPDDEGGLGQGDIALVRSTPGPAPANPWDPPSQPIPVRTPLDGAARGVGKELIGAPVENGGQIVATDLSVIVTPWGGEYGPRDVLEIDGRAVTVLKVERIPEAGTTCAIRFTVRR